jgi:hypothetical protein
MKRKGGVLVAFATMAALALVIGLVAPNAGTAQEEDLRPTVEAMQTQISGLQTQVADLMPPTPRAGQPTPTKAASAPQTGGDGRSRNNPLALGETVTVGDYQLRVIAVNTDAEAIVLEENMFNEPAGPGMVMVMATIELTYIGPDESNMFDLSYEAIAGNVGYASYEASCGVVPNESWEMPTLYTGATGVFNECWVLPAEYADSVVMSVEELMSWDDDTQRFLALYE